MLIVFKLLFYVVVQFTPHTLVRATIIFLLTHYTTTLKKIFKYTVYFITGIIVFLLLYLGIGFVLSRVTIDKDLNQPEDVAIYIKTNGVHTDVVLPVKTAQLDWSKEIKFSNTHLADSTRMKWLAMGWGDKGFYLQTPTWSDLKFSVAFKAMTGLSTTAIHATFYDTLQETESCKKIIISNAQYARLTQYILNSFRQDADGHLERIVTNANYNDADAFYEANGHYSMFHTCNTWANSALKACGQRACLWTAFDTGIFLKYK